jgi:hypothetical protein
MSAAQRPGGFWGLEQVGGHLGGVRGRGQGREGEGQPQP